MPLTPPPTTRAVWSTPTVMYSRGWSSRALATAIFTRSWHFAVACSGSSWWTQVHWLRILAISKRYLLRPAVRSISWKMGWWVEGLQAATTTRFRLCSLIISTIWAWASWEQLKRLSWA